MITKRDPPFFYFLDTNIFRAITVRDSFNCIRIQSSMTEVVNSIFGSQYGLERAFRSSPLAKLEYMGLSLKDVQPKKGDFRPTKNDDPKIIWNEILEFLFKWYYIKKPEIKGKIDMALDRQTEHLSDGCMTARNGRKLSITEFAKECWDNLAVIKDDAEIEMICSALKKDYLLNCEAINKFIQEIDSKTKIIEYCLKVDKQSGAIGNVYRLVATAVHKDNNASTELKKAFKKGRGQKDSVDAELVHLAVSGNSTDGRVFTSALIFTSDNQEIVISRVRQYKKWVDTYLQSSPISDELRQQHGNWKPGFIIFYYQTERKSDAQAYKFIYKYDVGNDRGEELAIGAEWENIYE